MCGIVAIWQRDGRPADPVEMAAMRDLIAHRGPDDAGLLVDGPVALGHRRLSIIDLGGGQQPMRNAAGTTAIVFNGEIYNYRELRDHLLARGTAVRTSSDTETILGLYDLYGERCLEHLRGMFAFVLWDQARRRMFVARDRLGIKPLYVFRKGRTLAFASEVKAFLALKDWSGDLNTESISEYMVYRDVNRGRTLFRDVDQLFPGEQMIVEQNAEHRSNYWSLPVPDSAANEKKDVARWREELDALLGEVVREHLISDVPLGTFNSGGVDSSLVTAYAARAVDRPINTHAIVFDDPAYDEGPYADIVARRWRTMHHTFRVNESEYAELLPTAIWHLDQPLNHPNSIPIYSLSRLARRNVTVVLTGEGSDELFGGYPRYRLPRLLDRFGMLFPILTPLLRAAAGARSAGERARIRAALHADGVNVAGLTAFVSPEDIESLRNHAHRAGTNSNSGVRHTARPPHVLAETLFYDQQTYLQGLLKRLDKMNMASGLEGRVPFLDHRVVEMAAKLPPWLKVNGYRTKYLLKEVARSYLPPEIVDRTKVGLAVPISRWLRAGGVLTSYVDMLSEPNAQSRAFFDGREVARRIEEHRTGKRDHGETLWGLINLEVWLRVMVSSKPAARPAVELGAVASA